MADGVWEVNEWSTTIDGNNDNNNAVYVDGHDEELKEAKNRVLEEISFSIEEIDETEIETKGISIAIGNKVISFKKDSEYELDQHSVEEEVKKAFDKKMKAYQSKVEEKYKLMLSVLQRYKDEIASTKKSYENKLKSSNIMPDITREHAIKGLTITKGASYDVEGVLYWYYQGIYWPKFLNGVPLDANYTKKLITPITIIIKTLDDSITNLVVHQTIGLNKFEHYHSLTTGDCWGSWDYKKKWKTADDIITVAQDAVKALENVNGTSLGMRAPSGLPRYNTLKNHLAPDPEQNLEIKIDNNNKRIGVNTERGNVGSFNGQNIWSS